LKITEITANRVTNVDLLSNAFLGSGTPMVAARGMLHFRQAVGNGAGIDTKFGNPVTVAAAATDPATTMALANDLRAKLVAMGMLS
jgi:PPE-repeat protein